jgi:hypothetical protein
MEQCPQWVSKCNQKYVGVPFGNDIAMKTIDPFLISLYDQKISEMMHDTRNGTGFVHNILD